MDEYTQRILRSALGGLLHDPFTSATSLLPHWEVEKTLERELSLSKDQLRLALALLASVPLGLGIRLCRGTSVRHLYALLTGAGLLYYTFGNGCLHAAIPAGLTYLIMALMPRSCAAPVWILNFGYLIWLHVISCMGDSYEPGALDFTGAEMVLVLKLISLATCYQDARRLKKEAMTAFQAEHAVQQLPSPLAYSGYVLALGNLLAGPYLEFTDYRDFIHLKGVWDPGAARPVPPAWQPGLVCLAKAAFFMAAYMYLTPRLGWPVLFTPWYSQLPFPLRCVVQFAAGVTSQFKYCFAWTLSEASLTAAGLNFSGWDPSGRPLWGRYANIHFFRLMLLDSGRLVPQHWNIVTGQFLRRYVYERLTRAGRKPGFFQLLCTQLTSALWHGLSGGHFLFFASTALAVRSSHVVYGLEQRVLPPGLVRSRVWWLAKVVWTQYLINYLVLAFHIMSVPRSLQVWASTYFWAHAVILLTCFVVGPLVPRGSRRAGAHDSVKTE
uniref:Acyl-CoA: diacylglycerol acyltransferase 1 n=1 Tax=Haematococcus lacustris TaxID=44745 RepID=A0A8E4L0M7_HAELA|nr:LPAT [Haematococcus lacustris]QNL10738.1 acyl-CoA: diacylglycerol acyltransferase 1 [Haematococcus lacustris]